MRRGGGERKKNKKKVIILFQFILFWKASPPPPSSLIFHYAKWTGKKENDAIGEFLCSNEFLHDTKCPNPEMLRHFWHILLLEFIFWLLCSSCFKPQRYRKTHTCNQRFQLQKSQSHITLELIPPPSEAQLRKQRCPTLPQAAQHYLHFRRNPLVGEEVLQLCQTDPVNSTFLFQDEAAGIHTPCLTSRREAILQ